MTILDIKIAWMMCKQWFIDNKCLFVGHNWQYGEGWVTLDADNINSVYVEDYRCMECLRYKDPIIDQLVYKG